MSLIGGRAEEFSVCFFMEKNHMKTVKTKQSKPQIAIVALGGSIVFPHLFEQGGLNIPFLKAFRKFVLEQVKIGRRFIIIVGGGKASRVYQNATREITDCKPDDLDWMGIEITKINALLIINILKEVACPQIMRRQPTPQEVKSFLRSNKKVLVGSGWKPGQSTDYNALKSAELFGVGEVIIAGDSAFVCDKDPKKFAGAIPMKEVSWADYQKLIPDKWVPGMSTPVDPTAARLGRRTKIIAKTIKGTDLGNFEKAISGQPFEGTIIGGVK